MHLYILHFIQIYQDFLTLLRHHIVLTVVLAICTGLVLGVSSYGSYTYRRARRRQRLVNDVHSSEIEELEYRGFFWRIRIRNLARTGKLISHATNAQAPAARAQGLLRDTASSADGVFTYYFPETPSNTYPMGLRAGQKYDLLFGNPPEYTIPLLLHEVLVWTKGFWYPAIVDEQTGFTVLRHTLKRRVARTYWLRGYRNMYVCDYVAQGDVLGSVTPIGEKTAPVVVQAPTDGFILAFEVLPFTNVVPRANALFLAHPDEVKDIHFDGDRAGFFAYPPGQQSPVGAVVKAGAVLATVASKSFLGFPQEILAPEDLLVVRQYKNPGDPVRYKMQDGTLELLFQYIPLQKPLA